jgi:hypothetical protein
MMNKLKNLFSLPKFESKWDPVYEKLTGKFLGEQYVDITVSKYRVNKERTQVQERGEEWDSSHCWRDLSPSTNKIFLKKLDSRRGKYFSEVPSIGGEL